MAQSNLDLINHFKAFAEVDMNQEWIHTHWLTVDGRIEEKSWLGRVLWKLSAKYPWIQRYFFQNVDLTQTRENLVRAIRVGLLSNQLDITTIQKIEANYNRIVLNYLKVDRTLPKPFSTPTHSGFKVALKLPFISKQSDDLRNQLKNPINEMEDAKWRKASAITYDKAVITRFFDDLIEMYRENTIRLWLIKEFDPSIISSFLNEGSHFLETLKQSILDTQTRINNLQAALDPNLKKMFGKKNKFDTTIPFSAKYDFNDPKNFQSKLDATVTEFSTRIKSLNQFHQHLGLIIEEWNRKAKVIQDQHSHSPEKLVSDIRQIQTISTTLLKPLFTKEASQTTVSNPFNTLSVEIKQFNANQCTLLPAIKFPNVFNLGQFFLQNPALNHLSQTNLEVLAQLANLPEDSFIKSISDYLTALENLLKSDFYNPNFVTAEGLAAIPAAFPKEITDWYSLQNTCEEWTQKLKAFVSQYKQDTQKLDTVLKAKMQELEALKNELLKQQQFSQIAVDECSRYFTLFFQLTMVKIRTQYCFHFKSENTLQAAQELFEKIKSWMKEGIVNESIKKFQANFDYKLSTAKEDLEEFSSTLSLLKKDSSLTKLDSQSFYNALDSYLQKAQGELNSPKDSFFPVKEQFLKQVEPLVVSAKTLKSAIQDFNQFYKENLPQKTFEIFLMWRNQQATKSKK